MSGITIPRCFRRDEPPEQAAERVARLVARLRELEKAYWNELNDDGRRLIRKAGFAAFVDGRLRERLGGVRPVFVDGDGEAV